MGIGGIGMSGLAIILKQQGYTISGCDVDIHQKSIYNLQKNGCFIFEGNNTLACHDKSIDILVYSSAIKTDNPEIMAAQSRGIPIISRAIMLAELMRTKFSIAIAGAHGKTTTTSLISHILMEGSLKPTVIIGGHLQNISSNALCGNGDFLVAEADESDRSLVNLHATFAVITNIDQEHFETYRDIEDIKQTFKKFLNNLPFYGKAILCTDDVHIRSLLPMQHLKIIKYGINEYTDITAYDLQLFEDFSTFNVVIKKDNLIFPIKINMPGHHNILNALAAIGIAYELNVDISIIQSALASFPGVDRRFTFKGYFNNALVYDDYGHHPEEINCTLKVARKKASGKLIVIFQPHRFTRTKFLWNEFIEVLSSEYIDRLVITDIFPASEQPLPTITSARLVAEIKNRFPHILIDYIPFNPDFNQIKDYLTMHANPGDLILLQGAGKINKIASLICQDPLNQVNILDHKNIVST